MIFLFHFLALLLFVVTQENRKVSMRSKLWWCEVQKSGIFGLFTGWIFFSLFSGWRICIPIESGFIQPDFFFFLFRHFLVIFGIFFYISSGSNGLAGGVWCVFGIAQWGEIISKGAMFFSLLAISRDIYETFTLSSCEKFEKFLV